MKWYLGIILWGLMGVISPVIAQQCPQDLNTLGDELLKELPDYANRALHRSNVKNIYVIVAGKAEYIPLSLNNQEYPSNKSDQEVQQVFFTTLEREYLNNKVQTRQNYHWLLLGKHQHQWYVVRMFTRLGSTSPGLSSSPPRDSSQGALSQGINNWLRDCQKN